ncbi:MAG: hypothetical protein ACO1OB_07050 [Archangium sp.]
MFWLVLLALGAEPARKPGRYFEPAKEVVDDRPLRPVVNLFGTGGLLIDRGVLGVFGATASAGVMLRPGVGFVGVLFAQFSPDLLGPLHIYGLGPAVRFGSKSHVAVGGAPVLVVVPPQPFPYVPTRAYFTGSVFLQGAVVLGDVFTVMLQPTLYFGPVSPWFTVTAGLGAQL